MDGEDEEVLLEVVNCKRYLITAMELRKYERVRVFSEYREESLEALLESGESSSLDSLNTAIEKAKGKAILGDDSAYVDHKQQSLS